MKKLKFQVPLYQVDVTLVQIEGKEDADAILPILKEHKITQEYVDDVVGAISKDATAGGDTFRNLDMHKILVIFYCFKSERMRENVWSHEKRHIEDRIMEFCGVNDIESAGLLAGFLGEKFYDFKKMVSNNK